MVGENGFMDSMMYVGSCLLWEWGWGGGEVGGVWVVSWVHTHYRMDQRQGGIGFTVCEQTDG